MTCMLTPEFIWDALSEENTYLSALPERNEQACNLFAELKAIEASSVEIDSRAVKQNAVFVAFKGEQVDGHDFIQAAKDQGALIAIVEMFVDADIAQIKVSSSLSALAQLAAKTRLTYFDQAKVIAITGSSGKTSTKELLTEVLAQVGLVAATQGNYNNEIGLPLTIVNADKKADFVVLEMGAAQIGDIEYLVGIAKPDVALITNVGTAHIGRFGGVDNIAQAKTEIYQGLNESGIAVINADDAYAAYFRQRASHCHHVSFGLKSNADLSLEVDRNRVSVVRDLKVIANFEFQAKAEFQYGNLLSVLACVSALGIDLDALNNVGAGVQPLTEDSNVEHRQQVFILSNAVTIIDDTYNANAEAMKSALEVLSVEAGSKRKLFVFGQMAELGNYSHQLHLQVCAYAEDVGVDKIFAIGGDAVAAVKDYSFSELDYKTAENMQELVSLLLDELSSGDVVLFKGSRSMHLDQAVAAVLENDKNNQWGEQQCC